MGRWGKEGDGMTDEEMYSIQKVNKKTMKIFKSPAFAGTDKAYMEYMKKFKKRGINHEQGRCKNERSKKLFKTVGSIKCKNK